MSGWYLDGGVETQVQEFSAPSKITASGTTKVFTAPPGLVSRIVFLRVTVTYANVNGEREVFPTIHDGNDNIVAQIIGGFETQGGPAFAPPTSLDLTYWLGAGTPTNDGPRNAGLAQLLGLIVLPDVWLPPNFTMGIRAVNLQGGDSIDSVLGMVQFRDEIGRRSNAALPGQLSAQALAFYLHTPT